MKKKPASLTTRNRFSHQLLKDNVALLSFAFEPLPYDAAKLTAVPVVNGVRLVQLIAQCERERGYGLPGAQGGVGRGDFTGDPFEHYFLGASADASVSCRRFLAFQSANSA